MKRALLILTMVLMHFFSIGQSPYTQKIHTKSGFFFKEECTGEYSFCSDGYWQFFRNYCLIADTDNPLAGYRDYGVYIFPYGYYLDTLVNRHIINMDVEMLTHLQNESGIIDSISKDAATVKIFCPRVKKKVNRYYKRNKIDKKFDGYFKYKKIYSTISYVYYGKSLFFLPKFNGKNAGYQDSILLDVYLIVDVQ